MELEWTSSLDPRSIPLDEYFFQTIPSICNSYYRKFLGFLAKPKQDSKNWTKDAFSVHLFAPRHSSTTSGTRITRDDPLFPSRSNRLKRPSITPLKVHFPENLYANLAVFRSTRRCSFPVFTAQTRKDSRCGSTCSRGTAFRPYIEL